MSDFILDHPLLATLLTVFVLVTGVGGCIYHYEKSTNDPIRMELSHAGYDVPDVEVFLGRIGSNLTEFKNSGGLRKQYELFANGESSDFIKQARAEKQAEEAESTANTALTVSAASMAMSASR